ncbi:MAG: Gfo/Idh/MocA family oxidoreductase [Geminicoccaceae bacterium]|nr:Gfo/Idh/MocA family oxidoreductase [Geminicoccaceae bacterium]
MSARILQIGAGIRGRHWLDYVKAFAGTECVALVEPDAGNLEKAKPLLPPGARTFVDLASALDQVEADAALIASPDRLHAEQAIACLERGLHVMVEKPFTPTVAEAARVLARAQELGRQVIVAEQYRFWAAERTVKQLLEEGRIGRVDHCIFTDHRAMRAASEGPWLAEVDYPQLQAVAVHHFDSLRMWFGRPLSLGVKAWRAPWSDYRGCECSQAQVDFGGVQVSYTGTMSAPRYACAIRIEGEKGGIWTNRRWVFLRQGTSRWFLPVKNVKVPPGDEKSYPQGGTTALLMALKDAVEKNVPAETRGEDNIWTIAMLEAAKKSAAEARRVAIGEVADGRFVTAG